MLSLSYLLSGEDYAKATALVITFVVNNYQNATFQAMANAWEKKFLELMENTHNSNLTIRYSAQVCGKFLIRSKNKKLQKSENEKKVL